MRTCRPLRGEETLISLADRQAEFAYALLDDSAPRPQGLVVPRDTRVEERFSVYRNNVAVGLIEALRSTFPVVERLVGVEFFRAMARTYAREELPDSPVLLAYGEGFSKFIAGFSPVMDLPYLADVARLEWHWVHAYHAADAEPFSLDWLQRFSEDRMPDVRLVLHPSVSVLSFEHPALSIWRVHQHEDVASMADVAYGPEAALVWRDGVDVRVVDIGAGAFCFLEALRRYRSLGAAVEAALEAEPDLNLSELIQRMFGLHIFVAAVDGTSVDPLWENVE